MRRSALLSLCGLALLVSLACCQPLGVGKNETRAPSVQPSVYRATAAEEKGEVIVQVACPCVRLPYDSEGKRLKGAVYVWENIKPLTVGKEVAAYDLKGRLLGKEAVQKALAKTAMVVCFVRRDADDPKRPDPAYLGVFREGTVVLVYYAKDIVR
jgi:hypothetical protein